MSQSSKIYLQPQGKDVSWWSTGVDYMMSLLDKPLKSYQNLLWHFVFYYKYFQKYKVAAGQQLGQPENALIRCFLPTALFGKWCPFTD